MTGKYEFKKWEGTLQPGDWDRLPRGYWTRIFGQEYEQYNCVFTGCPECGGVARLPHAVDTEGNVTPSLVCPYKPCTMHLIPVRLLGWSYGPKSKSR